VKLRPRVLAILAVVGVLLAPVSAKAIVGGTASEEGAWPFTAVLILDGEFTCGAAVISPTWAVTAAHCVHERGDADDFTVVVGRTNRSGRDGKEIGVSSIRVHPEYESDSSHDIALLALSQPAPVTAIAVADQADDRFEADGAAVRVTGWGDQVPALGLTSSQGMREVELRIVNDTKCGQRNLDLKPENGVCAGALLKDSCYGDSGGPLFAVDGGKPVLVGVVSYGHACAVPTSRASTRR
jgi:trypsin